ncbi:MAG: alanine racemase [bacterium]|nr:alanine racemase [bacterium]
MQRELKSEIEGLRTWVEIDKAALAHNYRVFRSRLGTRTKLMAIAKSNAYGHDLVQYATYMERLGADWIGVDSVIEALALRREGLRIPIFVLGHTPVSYFGEAAAKRITLTVSTFEGLDAWLRSSKKPSVHLKIDTGMHRQGFMPPQISSVLRRLGAHSAARLHIAGMYTHFAAAKNPAFPRDTVRQMSAFDSASEQFARAGYRLMRHAAATSGALLFPDSHYDMVRIGIGLYGVWPSSEVRSHFADALALMPSLRWRGIVSEVKRLPAANSIGYDLTETLARPTVVAICPVGYWHGYDRALSSIGHVLIRGSRARVLGRVSMDMIALDASRVKKIAVGDVVTLLGPDGKDNVSADEIADLCGTTSYEIITRLNPLMRRIYV